MKRLFFTFLNDVKLQWRNGFYAVSGIVIVLFALLSTQTKNLNLQGLLGAFLIGNLMVTGFYFVAGLLLLEKGEGTPLAQVVSPLKNWEYLLGKLFSLFILAFLESAVITLLYAGLNFRLLLLFPGLLLAFALFVFVGLIVITHYESVNAFLMPSVLVVVLLFIPLLGSLFNFGHWLFYLHPMQPIILLVSGAFKPLSEGTLLYSLLAGTAWAALFAWWSLRRLGPYMLKGV